MGAGIVIAISSCTVARSYQITGEPIGKKTGTVKTKIFGSSDVSLKAAAAKGNIKVIGAVQITTKVFIFPITTVKVYGE